MALSPVTPLPVQWQTCLVDIQPTSLYGLDHDIAMVNTTLLLTAPADGEYVFLLPLAEDSEATPILRKAEDPPDAAQAFTETTVADAEAELGQDLTSAGEEDKKLWDEVKRLTKTLKRARVRISQGEQLARFFYPQRIPAAGDGTYEFRILAPLASFVVQTGGEISLAVGLPRVPGRTIAIDEAVAENPPGTKLEDISQRPMIAERVFVGHYWRNDPLYRIKYRYV